MRSISPAKAIRRATMIAGSVKAAKRKHYDEGGSDGSDGGDGVGGVGVGPGTGAPAGTSTQGNGGNNGWGNPGNGPGQATAAGYGFGSGIGGAGSAGEAAGIGASTTGTGSFGNGFGNDAGGTNGYGVSAANSAPGGGVAGVGGGGVSTAGVTGSGGGVNGGGGGAEGFGGAPGPSGYGSTTNAYGSNVGQPGGGFGNSTTALNSQNQLALNNAAGLYGVSAATANTISPQLRAALANGTAGATYGMSPASVAAMDHLAGLTGITGETISPGGIYGIGNANMGFPSAGISQGPNGQGGVAYGNATTLGNSIGTANIGTGPSAAESPADTTVFGPHAGEAIANGANAQAVAAAQAQDALQGFKYGMATSPGVQSIRASLGMQSEFGPSQNGFSAPNAPGMPNAPAPGVSNMSAGIPGNGGFVAPGTNAPSAPAPAAANTSGGMGNHQVQMAAVGHGGHARGGRALRADGGRSLSDVIGQFSKDRTAAFTRPAAMDAPQYAANNNYGMQSPHLMMAELPQAKTESRLGSMTGDAGDLGQTLQNAHDDIWGKKANVNSGTGANASNSGVGNSGGSNRPGNASSTDTLSGLMANIAKTESGGWKNPYVALGPVVKSGDRAYGKYQVMGSNVPVWTKEVLGQSMTPAQFMNDPDAQEKVTRAKLGEYYNQYGTPEDAASMWFSGKPLAQGANLSDGNMTGGEYAVRATAGLPRGQAAPTAQADATPGMGAVNPGLGRPTPPPAAGLPRNGLHDDGTPITTPQPQAMNMDQGDDQGNLYNRVALMPSVQSGYQTPQALFAPDQAQARRGGYMRRAGGGPASGGMPSFMGNPLVMQALNYINKNGLGQHGNAGVNEVSGMRRGGRLHFAGGGGHGNFDQPPSGDWSPTNTYGMSYGENQQNDVAAAESEVNAHNLGLPGAGTVFEGNYPGVDPSLTGGLLGNSGSSSSAAPSGVPYTPPPPPQTYTPPVGGPSPGTGSNTKYNNTLDQVLGTNSPTMQQMFGFNYPSIPPPQPLPYASPDNGAAAAFEQFTGTAPSGNAPTLNSPPESSPGVLPPLIASGTVGNYSQYNPNGLSASQIPMAQPARRGGSIQHALNVARRAKAKG